MDYYYDGFVIKDNTTLTDLFVGIDTYKDSIHIITAEAAALIKVAHKPDPPKHRLCFVYDE